ncbi:MAG: hypothetical protein ACOX3U_01720 [Christensenellales bacterium]|jgi:hypothetical protein
MKSAVKRYPIIAFTLRFIALHTLTYLVFGVLFMLVSGYFEYFIRDPIFDLVMKPADALTVRIAPLVQVIRGALLALAVYPFREVFEERKGWLKLFVLLFILTGIGAVITGPGSIEGFLYTRFSFNPLIGYPEIGLQMFTFSLLFCRWQGKSAIIGMQSN